MRFCVHLVFLCTLISTIGNANVYEYLDMTPFAWEKRIVYSLSEERAWLINY